MPGLDKSLAAGLRDAAVSVARDLVRFVLAVEKVAGLDALSGMQRAQLDAVRRALVKVTGERPVRDEDISRVREYLGATRKGILAQLTSDQRLKIMEALLSVEVGEREVRAVMAPPRARRRSSEGYGRRVMARIKGEEKRRREEARTLPDGTALADCFAGLPPPWREAIWTSAGFPGSPTPAAMVRYLTDPGALTALVEALRPAERKALALILARGGTVLSRVIEDRWGDSAEDGFDWDQEPPTSLVGRLRLAGLVVVGRLASPDNPRSRPRVIAIPSDLRAPLQAALEAAAPIPPATTTVSHEIVDDIMGEDPLAGEVPFDHAQPELWRFVTALSVRLSRTVKPSAIYLITAGIWRCFDRAHPRRTARVRVPDVESARQAALEDLAAVETTHVRLMARRVQRMLSVQPHLYGYVASFLELARWPEADKLIVYHACDVTLRALHRTVCDE